MELRRSWTIALAALVFAACRSDPIADLKAGKVAAVEKALAKGTIQATGADATGKPLLLVAYEAGQAGVGKLLLENGADPNVAGASGKPLLHEVVASRKAPWVDALLASHLLDVHAADADGATALLLAVRGGDRETMGKLVARGANPFAPAKDGSAPYWEDVRRKPAPLFANDPTPCWERPGEDFPRALAAAAANDIAALKAHVEQGDCPNRASAHDGTGQTLLMAAVAAGAVDAAHLLLDHGADVHASRFTDARFVSALDLAKDPAMQALLRAHGARPAPERKADVLIAAGAKTTEELDGALAEWKERKLPFAPGFPQTLPSDRLAGLNPGWQIVVLGICEEGAGKAQAFDLHRYRKDVYARTVTVRTERLACLGSGAAASIQAMRESAKETRAEPKGGMTLVAREEEEQGEETGLRVELLSRTGEVVDTASLSFTGGSPYVGCESVLVSNEGAKIVAEYTCYVPYCTTPSVSEVRTVFWAEDGKIRSKGEELSRKTGDCDQ